MRKIAIIVAVTLVVVWRLLASDWFTVRVTSDQARLARLAMESKSWEARRTALERLSDSTWLAKVVMAVDGNDANRLQEVVGKLSDPVLLAKVIMELKGNDCPLVVKIALARLKDETLLSQIALRDGGSFGVASVWMLENQAMLAKIAAEGEDKQVRRNAAIRLNDLDKLKILLQAAATANDAEVYEIASCKLLTAAQDIVELPTSSDDAAIRLYARVFQKIRESPIPDKHRERLFIAVSKVLGILSIPCIAADTGSMEDLKIGWKSESETYQGHVVQGERVSLSVKLSKTNRSLQCVWATDFPSAVSESYIVEGKRRYLNERAPDWLAAAMDGGAFYSALSPLLTDATHVKIALEAVDLSLRRAAVENLKDQAVLAQIAMEKQVDWEREKEVRLAAVGKLSNQEHLFKIATTAWESDIRHAATRRLDQAMLAKISVEGNDWHVREIAVEKLEDQLLLGRIAVKDRSESVRKAAVKKIMDQGLLNRIAMEDEDEWCRLFAAEKLVDESLLAKIAVEDSHRDVRAAAVKKLKDQGLMARIAVEDEDRFVREAAVEKLRPPYDHVDDVMVNTANYQMRLERRKEARALVEQIVESRERHIRRVAVEKLIKMRTQAQPKERESP